MHAWEQIQFAVDTIEERLGEEIKIEELARHAAFSPFYFQRLFARLVKRPVNEYIKLRRLARASEALKSANARILDVALDSGFSSHETFTRAFKEAYGMTPEEYRAHPVALRNFFKPQLLLNYALVDEGVPLIADGIVIEIGRRALERPMLFAGLVVEQPIGNTLGSGAGIDTPGALWNAFHERKDSLPYLAEGGDELGVAYAGTKEGHFRYFAGAAVAGAIPEGCATWELAAGEYIVCTFEAEDFMHLTNEALYKANNYLLNNWLPRHNLTLKPFIAERYPSHEPETTMMELWIMPVPVA